MKDDYREMFAAMSAAPKEMQNAMLRSLTLAEGDQITREEVQNNDIIWAAVPWSDIRDQPDAAAARQAATFRRMLGFGADNGPHGGKVLFTIAGLAADRRELWEVPEVRSFCLATFLLYPPALFALVDEDNPGVVAIVPDDATRLAHIPGRLFFASLAFGDRLWERHHDGELRYFAELAREVLQSMMRAAAEGRQ